MTTAIILPFERKKTSQSSVEAGLGSLVDDFRDTLRAVVTRAYDLVSNEHPLPSEAEILETEIQTFDSASTRLQEKCNGWRELCWRVEILKIRACLLNQTVGPVRAALLQGDRTVRSLTACNLSIELGHFTRKGLEALKFVRNL
jgi:hypothetical protein